MSTEKMTELLEAVRTLLFDLEQGNGRADGERAFRMRLRVDRAIEVLRAVPVTDMADPAGHGPLDDLDREERRAVGEARSSAFATLLDLTGEARADELFSQMVADAFCDHFLPDEGGREDAAPFVRVVNAGLARAGSPYRVGKTEK
jgi:hypothetical protein